MESVNVLINILNQATSQEPHVVKHAEERLKVCEDQPDFYRALLSICFNQELQTEVRWMAILFFKNGMDKYWRRAVNRIFTEEDKYAMKQVLISSFTEVVHQISLQKAVVIGRIARTDLKTWPELIQKVLQEVRNENKTIQFNALLTLNHIIKGLVSKRLASDRRIFKELSSGIFEFVFDLWMHHSNLFISHLSASQTQPAEEYLKMSVLALKVLRKLLVEGSSEAVDTRSIMLLNVLIERIPTLLQLRSQFSSFQNISEKLEKLIIIGMKLLLGTQDRHPLLFVNVLESALSMAINYVFVTPEKDILFEIFIVQCANLIKKIIKAKEYKIPKDSQLGKNISEDTKRAHEIKEKILTQPLVTEFCKQLIMKYFPLNSQELNEWESDPETYMSEEAGDSAEYLIRPCTENLFLCLYYEHRPIFTEVLSSMVNSLNVSYNKGELGCFVSREAVYFALGLASYELFGDLNFDEYFQKTLLNELQNSSRGMNIIHRRILWLIGRWINVSFSKESRVILYQLLTKMLERSEDLVVRITAAKTLKDAVDDYQFETADITMYLKELWEKLFYLLVDVHQCDTKMTILNVMSILIERAGKKMKSYTAALCEYLPHLWQDSADHNMLRCVVVVTLNHIVEALGEVSQKLHPLLLPVIQLSTDQNQPSHVYLIDDGLDLWHAVIENSAAITEDCLHLFDVLPILLEQTSENFKTCISIIKSYLLLDAVQVLKIHSSALIGVIDSLLGQMKDEGNILLSELIQCSMILLPNEAPILFENCLKKALKIIVQDQEYPRVVTSYLFLFGYMILHNSSLFFNLLHNVCLEINEKPERLAARLLDTWLDKIDFLADDKPRKMTAMALVSLLRSNAEFVNERFALILDAAVNVLHGIARENDQVHAIETPVDGDSIEKEPSLGKQREKQLLTRDPVYSASLLEFVRMKIAEAKIALGDELFQSLIETMDPVVAKQLMSLLG